MHPALLLVHGWGSAASTFDELAGRLGADHRVLVPDLRGHGGRQPEPDGHSVPAMLDDLVALLQERGAPVVAIGHSLGGQLVSTLAATRPDLVGGAVLIDPAYAADQATVAAVPERAAAIRAGGAAAAARATEPALSEALPPQARAHVLDTLCSTPSRVLLESLETTYTGPDEAGSLATIRTLVQRRRVPVLALYSGEPAADRERSLPSAGPVDIRIAPGPGHYVHLEHPDWTHEAIRSWLTGG